MYKTSKLFVLLAFTDIYRSLGGVVCIVAAKTTRIPQRQVGFDL